MIPKAKIHSIETCGTVDGPGIRYVIFFQGCPLRCKYCHNPDTWNISAGNEILLDELLKDIVKYKIFMKYSNGGITASGGEPLLQGEFLSELFKLCKAEKIQTALDTSGYVFNEIVKKVLNYTDIVLLDIKAFDDNIFKNITGKNVSNTLKFMEYINSKNICTWIRFVLVPQLTDNLNDIENIAKYISKFKNIERIDILPFHKMGEYKWEELNYTYVLKNTLPPEKEILQKVKNIFRSYNLYTP